jgi:hypothetical protein
MTLIDRESVITAARHIGKARTEAELIARVMGARNTEDLLMFLAEAHDTLLEALS